MPEDEDLILDAQRTLHRDSIVLATQHLNQSPLRNPIHSREHSIDFVTTGIDSLEHGRSRNDLSMDTSPRHFDLRIHAGPEGWRRALQDTVHGNRSIAPVHLSRKSSDTP